MSDYKQFKEINDRDVYLFEYTKQNQKIINRLSNIGYSIKGISTTLFIGILTILTTFSNMKLKSLSMNMFLFFSIMIFLILWLIDVINLRNEKIFRKDYSYKLKNSEKLNNLDILNLTYIYEVDDFKIIKKEVLWESIKNLFTMINLAFAFTFTILIIVSNII